MRIYANTPLRRCPTLHIGPGFKALAAIIIITGIVLIILLLQSFLDMLLFLPTGAEVFRALLE